MVLCKGEHWDCRCVEAHLLIITTPPLGFMHLEAEAYARLNRETAYICPNVRPNF